MSAKNAISADTDSLPMYQCITNVLPKVPLDISLTLRSAQRAVSMASVLLPLDGQRPLGAPGPAGCWTPLLGGTGPQELCGGGEWWWPDREAKGGWPRGGAPEGAELMGKQKKNSQTENNKQINTMVMR